MYTYMDTHILPWLIYTVNLIVLINSRAVSKAHLFMCLCRLSQRDAVETSLDCRWHYPTG